MSKTTRTIFVAQHRTSVRMEARIWQALLEIAKQRGQDIDELLQDVENWRKLHEPGLSRSAALRVFAVEYFRASLRDTRVAGPWVNRTRVWSRVE